MTTSVLPDSRCSSLRHSRQRSAPPPPSSQRQHQHHFMTCNLEYSRCTPTPTFSSAYFAPDLPASCRRTVHRDDDSSHSDEEDRSYRSESSSFFIPGITARARCLEDTKHTHSKKVDARTLYTPRYQHRTERRPAYITTSVCSSRSIDEEDVSFCNDNDDNNDLQEAHQLVSSLLSGPETIVPSAVVTVSTKNVKKRHSRRNKGVMIEKQYGTSSVKSAGVLQSEGVPTTKALTREIIIGWDDYLVIKNHGMQNEALQLQITSIRSMIQEQTQRMQFNLSFRDEVAKTA